MRTSTSLSRKRYQCCVYLFFLLVLFTGCVLFEKNPVDSSIRDSDSLIYSKQSGMLHENTFTSSQPITITRSGRLFVFFRIRSWPEDYGVELFVIPSEYLESFEMGYFNESLWVKIFKEMGLHTVETDTVEAGDEIRIIVDNSDRGWESTDYDGLNDKIVFDLEVYLRPFD